MANKFYFFWIAGVVIVSLLYLLTEKLSLKLLKIKADNVAFESAKIALERLSTWTTWLTGLQTAAMAAMALLIKGREVPLTQVQTKYGFFVLLFFWCINCPFNLVIIFHSISSNATNQN